MVFTKKDGRSHVEIPSYVGRVKAVIGKDRSNVPRESEIGVWINVYEDIFSDFDSRPFSQRTLSDDFLLEMKKASRDKPSGGIELKILAPAKLRSFSQEALIKKRLKEHFTKHYVLLQKDVHAMKNRGLIMAFFGTIMIFLATYVLSSAYDSFFSHLLVVILEPAGWFCTWMGLEHFFYKSRDLKRELDFYEKMANCEVEFMSY